MKLQMSTAKKYSVGGTFGLGGLSIIFAAVRLYILIRDQSQTDVSCKYFCLIIFLINRNQILIRGVVETAAANLSLVEPEFELFRACIPCMAPLLHTGRYLLKLKGSLYGSNSSYSSHNPSHGSKNIDGRELFHAMEHQKAAIKKISLLFTLKFNYYLFRF